LAARLFRTVALERQSSPEQLDSLLQVTSPKGWAALAATGALLLCALLWGFVGRMPIQVSGQGVLVYPGNGGGAAEAPQALQVVMYVPAGAGGGIRTGMPAQISPRGIEPARYGVLRGTVTRVAEAPSSRAEVMEVLQNEALVAALLEDGAPLEVRLELATDPQSPSGYAWSSSAGPDIVLQSGMVCSISVTIAEQRPIDRVVPLPRRSAGTPG
jgi:hypothetical protein